MKSDAEIARDVEKARSVADSLITVFRENDIPIPMAISGMLIAIGNATVAHCYNNDDDMERAKKDLHTALENVINRVDAEYKEVMQGDKTEH